MTLQIFLQQINTAIWNFPFLIFLVVIGLIVFVATYGAPIRFFFPAWKLIFAKEERAINAAQMSPLQAFINTIGASIGNGSIAGIGTAIFAGGPGAIFWMFIVGFFSMAWRFAEVYLATYFIGKATFGTATGGPMVYLSKVPGGSFLPYFYATVCLVFSLLGGNIMQANSIAGGLEQTWSISPYITAFALFAFITYALMGSAQRIIRISDRLVPFKVAVFMIAALIVLFYHFASLPAAISLIITSAINPSAAMGGFLGFSIQQAMSEGFSRGISANEGGLGTSAMFFGTTTGKNPIKDSMLGMIGAFLTTHIIGMLVAIPIVASGVWNSGADAIKLSIASFNTVFGNFGGWIVTFSAASFGLSVIVSYAFLTLECWKFLTKNQGRVIFIIIYSLTTFLGSIMPTGIVWSLVGITNAILLLTNLFGILWLLPIVRKGIAIYLKQK